MNAPAMQPRETNALLGLLWLASPALPIGAYAYSHGLEQAVSRALVTDEDSLFRWVRGVLARQLATSDAPVLARVHQAALCGDDACVQRWNRWLAATRESRELALEDAQLGMALLRLARERVPIAIWPDREAPSYAVAYGLVCAAFDVPVGAAVSAFLFAFAESQVTAALKCLVMGQTAGQRVLARLMAEIDALTAAVLALPDERVGAFAPGLSLASALHETQYSRLFRS